jgi:hypothetical protein
MYAVQVFEKAVSGYSQNFDRVLVSAWQADNKQSKGNDAAATALWESQVRVISRAENDNSGAIIGVSASFVSV